MMLDVTCVILDVDVACVMLCDMCYLDVTCVMLDMTCVIWM